MDDVKRYPVNFRGVIPPSSMILCVFVGQIWILDVRSNSIITARDTPRDSRLYLRRGRRRHRSMQFSPPSEGERCWLSTAKQRSYQTNWMADGGNGNGGKRSEKRLINPHAHVHLELAMQVDSR